MIHYNVIDEKWKASVFCVMHKRNNYEQFKRYRWKILFYTDFFFHYLQLLWLHGPVFHFWWKWLKHNIFSQESRFIQIFNFLWKNKSFLVKTISLKIILFIKWCKFIRFLLFLRIKDSHQINPFNKNEKSNDIWLQSFAHNQTN